MPLANVDDLATNAPLPEDYHYQRLTRDYIPDVVRSFADWYPGKANMA